MDAVITVDNLSKRFRRRNANQPTTLKELVLKGLRGLRAEYFWGLRDLSFRITAGRTVGIIGQNGAGKSTLLRMIGGVGKPDRGSVRTKGRISALLDLGAGFHPELTGRENVYIAGVIAGLTRAEISERFEAMVSFAELEDFIDNPFRTYSSGMQMRLAFAVAAHTDPQILVIDEVLAVGDIAFQRKCLQRIAQFKAEGCTIVLVSHEPALIRELCDEVLWLRSGQLVAHGAADVVVGQYVAEMTVETRRRTPSLRPNRQLASGAELELNTNRFGSMDAEITEVRLLDAHGLPLANMESGDTLRVLIDYASSQPIPAPILSVSISREDGLVCYDTHTAVAGIETTMLAGQRSAVLHIDRLDLVGGLYYVDVGIHEQNWQYSYDYHWHVYPLTVNAGGTGKGILHTPHQWEVETEQPVRLLAS